MSKAYLIDKSSQAGDEFISGELPEYPPDAAIFYAEHGIPIFPCHSIRADGRCSCGNPRCTKPGKRPYYNREDLRHGHESATSNLEQVRRWWRRWPDAQLAMPTGMRSGVVVVDTDKREAPERKAVDGYATLKRLQDQYGQLVVFTSVRTGSGDGEHGYFSCQGPVRSCVLGDGLELKADGNYVILPPSTGAECPYEFIRCDGLSANPRRGYWRT